MIDVLPDPVGRLTSDGMSPEANSENSFSCHGYGLWPVNSANTVANGNDRPVLDVSLGMLGGAPASAHSTSYEPIARSELPIPIICRTHSRPEYNHSGSQPRKRVYIANAASSLELTRLITSLFRTAFR